MRLVFTLSLLVLLVTYVTTQDDGDCNNTLRINLCEDIARNGECKLHGSTLCKLTCGYCPPKGCGSFAAVSNIRIDPLISDRIQENSSPLTEMGGTAALHSSGTNLGSSTHKCGASMISDRYLLTSAHCMLSSVRLVSISLGRENLDENPGSGTDTYEIEKFDVHPDYDTSRGKYDDIAILKTDRKIVFKKGIWPYCLPQKDQTLPDFSPLQVAGWGREHLTFRVSTINSAFVRLVKNQRCENIWRQYKIYDRLLNTYPKKLTSQIICAGRDGVDACEGDSGGPLTHQNEIGQNELIGIVANGISFCPEYPVIPGFYINIRQYLDWIYNTTGLPRPPASTNGPQYTTPCPIDTALAHDVIELCKDIPCGVNAECQERDNKIACSCPQGFEGDAFINCTMKDTAAFSGSEVMFHTVGDDRFITLNTSATCSESKEICKALGLDLLQLKNISAVAQYLQDTYGDDITNVYWIGGQGNGRRVVWLSGTPVNQDERWGTDHWNGINHYDQVENNRHLVLSCRTENLRKNGKVLWMRDCETHNFSVLCG